MPAPRSSPRQVISFLFQQSASYVALGPTLRGIGTNPTWYWVRPYEASSAWYVASGPTPRKVYKRASS